MIKSKDRSGWFGASDTKFIVGNFGTETFKNWWAEKLGIIKNDFQNKYTLAGTHYEHKVLDAYQKCNKDKQVRIKALKLRVNLDGDTGNEILEVKTHKGRFNLSKAYREQVIVQMFATGIKKAKIISYQMTDAEYDNYFLPIDVERIQEHPIQFDKHFITNVYLPRLLYLRECLRKGKMPSEIDMRKAKAINGFRKRRDDYIISNLLRKQEKCR